MLLLIKELALGLEDGADRSSGLDDESSVKRVATRSCLVGDDTKVAGDTCRWVGGGAKTVELRVSGVAASSTEKHRLRQESLAPQSNQAGGIEMSRMHSPEAHEAM